MTNYHLAQINGGRLHAPIDDPRIAESAHALGAINAIPDESPGFAWRLQTDKGNTIGIQPTDDPLFLINMSTWETADALFQYVYRSDHVDFMRKRSDWFRGLAEPYMSLWWVRAGEVPTPQESLSCLNRFRRADPSEHPFSFRNQHPPPGREEGP